MPVLPLDPLARFNFWEACLWFVVALIVLASKMRGLTWRLRGGLAISLILFGVSDLIEMRTGAWWRPIGLLILKGACVMAIASGFIMLWRRREPKSPAPEITPEHPSDGDQSP